MMSSRPSVRSRVGYILKQAQHALRVWMDHCLRDLDLTTGQYALMVAVEEASRASGAELARRCFITPQSVTGLITRPLERGLIERAASRTHGRIIEISLTVAGRSRLLKAHAIVNEIEDDMLSGLGASERRAPRELAYDLRQEPRNTKTRMHDPQ